MESSPIPRRVSRARPVAPLLRTAKRPILRLARDSRVRVRGKFLYADHARFDVKGVTYGPFRPDENGSEYHDLATVDRDFAAIAASGMNAVRTYTVPPRWLLDAAASHGLRVMVGVPWEQHVAFLDDRRIRRRIIATVREAVRSCAGHPAVLCFTVGNEIPAPIVRYHGPAAIERFVRRLYDVAKNEDPQALITYVNYPTTEYLDLSFLDLLCFNVYLEDQQKLATYLARLQNLAAELPLVMAEVGLDSIRNGEEQQAESLTWQLRTSFQAGCAGAFVFAWTDEWHRGGHDIEDWAFGLTDRNRDPKPALAAVRDTMTTSLLLPAGAAWPKISVVVCSYNGARTIHECLQAVADLDYPNYEVIVINDGSEDNTSEIARQFDVRLINIENGGLSNARNLGMHAAEGEIVAYIDDDAYPDPHWLSYLAVAFLTTEHVGIGGPNLAPPGDGVIADCVANSPGGPSHVLFSDTEAEHLPGCNMAFRRAAILAADGFDTRFRIAGDDVDLCWRLLEQGGTLGFHAGAVVWHHRRDTVAAYLRQQRNYGRAEAMLEVKWPAKYNRLGHLRWAGQVYGKGQTHPISLGPRQVHHGVWGSRLFQPMYAGENGSLWYLTVMPEWYLVTIVLLGFCLLGLFWMPLLWVVVPLLLVAVAVPTAHVCASAAQARFASRPLGRRELAGLYLRTAGLHILQPLARLAGRVGYKLTPWRRHGAEGATLPWPRTVKLWSESWRSQTEWLRRLEKGLQHHRVLVRRGGDCDRWDLQAVCGLLGGARLVSTVEEHGAGRQMIRVRVWPRLTGSARLLIPLFALLSLVAGLDHAFVACTVLALVSLLLLIRSLRECGTAIHSVRCVVEDRLPNDIS
jgi:glycosyltransferase involved in cell wall biosynthesis